MMGRTSNIEIAFMWMSVTMTRVYVHFFGRKRAGAIVLFDTLKKQNKEKYDHDTDSIHYIKKESIQQINQRNID